MARRMRRNMVLLLAGLIVAVNCSGTAVIAGGKGSVDTGMIMGSPSLGRPIPYSIYRPQAPSPTQGRWPVLFLLHGHGDDETAWIEKGGIVPILDRLIADGTIKPMLVVMPAAGNSWYVDDVKPGRFGTVAKAFTTDLVAGIEKQYPAGGCRQARAVGGLSMGGYGAVLYALDRPDLFAASFSLSGSLFKADPTDIERRRSTYERIFKGVFGDPFDAERFRSSNVFVKLSGLRPEAPRPVFWLSAGDRDFPSILDGTISLHTELKQRGFESKLQVMDGGHTWVLWNAAVEPALVSTSARLSPGCSNVAR